MVCLLKLFLRVVLTIRVWLHQFTGEQIMGILVGGSKLKDNIASTIKATRKVSKHLTEEQKIYILIYQNCFFKKTFAIFALGI